MISVIRPANITPLSLVKMTTQTSSQWLALPSFDEVPFVRKNTRITAKIQSQIRPIAASTSNIEQWCPREIIWYAFGDLSCLSDESISWLYLFNKQLEKQYWGGTRNDNFCDASPWNNTCRRSQETWRRRNHQFSERFGHVYNKRNNHKSAEQANVL